MMRDAQAEHRDLAGAREKFTQARAELDRVEGALWSLQGQYDEYRRTYARARRRGASERDLAAIAERGKTVRARIARGHEYLPAERAKLDRDEEALRVREEALERSREDGDAQEAPAAKEAQDARPKGQQRVSGRLRNGREVEEYRRLTRKEGLSAEEARERVILARGGEQPAPSLQTRDDGWARAEPEAAPTDARSGDQERGIGMQEAAEALGCSTTTVRRRIERGEIKATKDPKGRTLVFLEEREDDHEMER